MAEALRLADELDAYHTRSCHKEAAAELRRLHAENEGLRVQRDALLEACKVALGIIGFGAEHDQISAAIKAVEGEKT